jgi:hypothetical protein
MEKPLAPQTDGIVGQRRMDKMEPLPVKAALDRYALGMILADDLPSIGVQALEDGYDSPSLRELAGTSGSDCGRIRDLFSKAIKELKLSLPTPAQAGLSLAKAIAMDVQNGTVTPYCGAERIWREVYIRFPELSQLLAFVGYASEYEDDEKNRDYYARMILEECKVLLRE